MVKNDRQLGVTKKNLSQFKNALRELKNSDDSSALKIIMRINAIESQIAEFEEEIALYEKLKSRSVREISTDFNNFNFCIIESRIANGLNHREFASLLDTTEQQIQRYEAENYESISLRTAQWIMQKLNVRIVSKFEFKNNVQPNRGFLSPKNLDTDLIQNKIRKSGMTVKVCEV